MTKTGFVDFTATNASAEGSRTLRVYWSSSVSEAPGAKSTVSITKVQFASSAEVGVIYISDFKLKINSTVVATISDPNWTVYPGNFNTFYDIKRGDDQITGSLGNISHDAQGNATATIGIEVNSWSYAGLVTQYYQHPAKFSGSKPITLSTIPVGTLTTSIATGSTASVLRSGSQILAGTNLYYGDVLTISAAAQTGYRLDALKVNNTAFVSGNTYPVTGNVAVETNASRSVCIMSTNATGTFGTSQTINVTTYITGATHTIVAVVGNKSQNVATDSTAASHSWTPANTLMNGSPNSMSATCTLTCTTKSNGTTIGTSSVTVTLSMVAATVKPTPTITHSDPNGYATTYGGYVSGKSLLSVSISDGLKYGASTVSRSSSANGITSGATSFSAGLVKSNSSITTEVTDSRGQKGSDSESITILSYTSPSITTFSVHRTDQYGTADDMGDYFNVTYAIAVTPLNDINSKTLTLKYKRVTSSTWTTQAISLLSYNESGVTAAIAASGDYSFDVQLVLSDDFESVTKTTKLSTAAVVESRRPQGKGVAFSKVAEYDNTFDIGTWTAIGRVFGLGAARENIPSSSVFSSYTEPGIYAVLDNATAQSIADCPSSVAGTLRVWIGNGNAKNYGDSAFYLLQEYMDYNGVLYRRKGQTSGGGTTLIWSSWDWYPAIILDERTITTDGSGYYQFTSDYPRDTYMIISIHTVNSSDTFVRVTGSGGATGQWVRVLKADGTGLASTSVKLRTVFIHL